MDAEFLKKSLSLTLGILHYLIAWLAYKSVNFADRNIVQVDVKVISGLDL